jgi:putative ABC transport system permease protein
MTRIPIRLVVAYLCARPVRTILALGSLAVALFLLVTLRSLITTLEDVVHAARSHRIVVQSAVSLVVELPRSYESKIRGVPGVLTTCRLRWFGAHYQEPSNNFAQFAADCETLQEIFPELEVVGGTWAALLADRQACVIGTELARDFGWKIGDTVPLISPNQPRTDGGAWGFRVAAIYRSRSPILDDRTLFFHAPYLERSVEDGAALGSDRVSVYWAKLAPDAERVQVLAAIDELFENGPQRVRATTDSEFQAQFISMVGNLPLLVGSIGGAVLIAVFLANLNTMLLAAREQVRDVGVLKALGFDELRISLVLLLQSVVLCAIGGGFGVALAWLGAERFSSLLSLGSVFPSYKVTGETALLGLAAALGIGLAAAIPPIISRRRLSTARLLSMEI